MTFASYTLRVWIFAGLLVSGACLAGCGGPTSGDPKDFGPVDTTHAAKSSDGAKVFPGFGKNDPVGHPNRKR